MLVQCLTPLCSTTTCGQSITKKPTRTKYSHVGGLKICSIRAHLGRSLKARAKTGARQHIESCHEFETTQQPADGWVRSVRGH